MKWIYSRIIAIKEGSRKGQLEGIAQDITELREKERQLEISNERFEMAMKVTNEIIWDWELKTGIITRSGGREVTNAYIHHLEDWKDLWFGNIYEEDRMAVKRSLMRVLSDPRRDQWSTEYRLVKPDGKLAFIVDRAYIIRNEKGEAVRVVGAALDVTESRKLIENIEQQNDTLRDIAWTQSHIVRAPLARILGLIDVIYHSKDTSRECDELLPLIESSARELDNVIRDIVKKTQAVSKPDDQFSLNR